MIIAANIEVTRDWWNSYRNFFTLYISKVVIDEVTKGDVEIAANRLEVLQGFPLLELSTDVQDLAAEFCLRSNLPPKASDDAVHIAGATVHGMDYTVNGSKINFYVAMITTIIAEKLAGCNQEVESDVKNRFYTRRC